MSQSKEELEKFYEQPDPWEYSTTPDDLARKEKILRYALEANGHKEYESALDIGAGEGWITKDLPAKKKFAIEISDNAAGRLPAGVVRVSDDRKIGKHDLVVATGVLYPHYDWRRMLDIVNAARKKIVLLCNIEEWEVPQVKELGEPFFVERFQYRGYTEVLRVYVYSA